MITAMRIAASVFATAAMGRCHPCFQRLELVQQILGSSKDIVVLDGIEQVPIIWEGDERSTAGDW